MMRYMLGDWRDVLADVECDALICDPPYGAAVHKNDDMAQFGRNDLTYGAWGAEDVHTFVDHWAPRTRGWMAIFTSHDLILEFQRAYARNGRYYFAPVPVLSHRPRLAGDGPGSCAVYLMVSRPKKREFFYGSLPGWYTYNQGSHSYVGGKPTYLMQTIVQNYTRDGDLVCDPCSGHGTTLVAAVREGRRAVGAERDPDVHGEVATALYAARPSSPRQPTLFEVSRTT